MKTRNKWSPLALALVTLGSPSLAQEQESNALAESDDQGLHERLLEVESELQALKVRAEDARSSQLQTVSHFYQHWPPQSPPGSTGVGSASGDRTWMIPLVLLTT